MQTEDDFSTWGFFDPQALRADRPAAIAAHFDQGACAPHILPPRATRGWAQDGAFFVHGQFPGSLWGHAQLAVGLVGVAVESQSLDVRVGDLDLGDVLAGETEWQSALPELVFMLDFAFGLGCWSIKDTNVLELERGTELGERIGIVREKDGVIIDVHLQRPSVAQESGGKEIEVGEQEFWAIDFGIDEHAATIVEHIKHGKVQQAWGEPAMGRSV